MAARWLVIGSPPARQHAGRIRLPPAAAPPCCFGDHGARLTLDGLRRIVARAGLRSEAVPNPPWTFATPLLRFIQRFLPIRRVSERTPCLCSWVGSWGTRPDTPQIYVHVAHSDLDRATQQALREVDRNTMVGIFTEGRAGRRRLDEDAVGPCHTTTAPDPATRMPARGRNHHGLLAGVRGPGRRRPGGPQRDPAVHRGAGRRAWGMTLTHTKRLANDRSNPLLHPVIEKGSFHQRRPLPRIGRARGCAGGSPGSWSAARPQGVCRPRPASFRPRCGARSPTSRFKRRPAWPKPCRACVHDNRTKRDRGSNRGNSTRRAPARPSTCCCLGAT